MLTFSHWHALKNLKTIELYYQCSFVFFLNPAVMGSTLSSFILVRKGWVLSSNSHCWMESLVKVLESGLDQISRQVGTGKRLCLRKAKCNVCYCLVVACVKKTLTRSYFFNSYGMISSCWLENSSAVNTYLVVVLKCYFS